MSKRKTRKLMERIGQLVQEVMELAPQPGDKPPLKRETSSKMAAVASEFVKITEAKWSAFTTKEQVKIVRSLAASVLSQDETKGQAMPLDAEGNSD